MTRRVSRRDFVSAAALGVAIVPLWPKLGFGQLARHAAWGGGAVRPMVQPFDLHRKVSRG